MWWFSLHFLLSILLQIGNETDKGILLIKGCRSSILYLFNAHSLLRKGSILIESLIFKHSSFLEKNSLYVPFSVAISADRISLSVLEAHDGGKTLLFTV